MRHNRWSSCAFWNVAYILDPRSRVRGSVDYFLPCLDIWARQRSFDFLRNPTTPTGNNNLIIISRLIICSYELKWNYILTESWLIPRIPFMILLSPSASAIQNMAAQETSYPEGLARGKGFFVFQWKSVGFCAPSVDQEKYAKVYTLICSCNNTRPNTIITHRLLMVLVKKKNNLTWIAIIGGGKLYEKYTFV